MTPVGGLRFQGALAPFQANLLWADDNLPQSVADVIDLTDRLSRFQHSVGGAWQPACSLWAQIYFNTLLIPGICLLMDGAMRPTRAAAIVGSFCPASGIPLRFALSTRPRDGAPAGDDGLLDLLDRHVDALVAELNAVSRLSKRLLRESAARTVAWTVRELAGHDPAAAKAVGALFGRRTDLCVLCLSMSHAADCRRRYCCLRDRLPGQSSCGAICPSGCGTRPRRCPRLAPS